MNKNAYEYCLVLSPRLGVSSIHFLFYYEVLNGIL